MIARLAAAMTGSGRALAAGRNKSRRPNVGGLDLRRGLPDLPKGLKRPLHPAAVRVEPPPHARGLHRRRLAHEPQQDDADGRLAQAYRQLAELRVLGQQHPTLRMGQPQDLVVAPPGIPFGDIAHLVAGLPQQMDEIVVASIRRPAA